MKTELQKALDILLFYRGDQVREGETGLPGIIHELSVVRRLSNWGIIHIPTLKLGMYHDLYEDTNCNHAEMVRLENEEMADHVQETTFRKKLENEISKDYQAYKQEALKAYRDKKKKTVIALTAKLADRLCNVEDFMGSKPDYASKYFHYADGLYDAVLERSDEIGSFYGGTVLCNIFIDINMKKALFNDGE